MRAANGCGSSPRMRGALHNWDTGRRRRTVHPRACGEHPAIPSRNRIGRFIPAHAGSTMPGIPLSSASVHPRACGEHLPARRLTSRIRRFIPAHAGSTFSVRFCHACQHRFIPAHAGSTPRAICSGISCGSSPRMRGALTGRVGSSPRMRGAQWNRPVKTGSSPRMRGAPHTVQESTNTVGSSPRMRGAPTEAHVIVPVHPRACGEHQCGWWRHHPGSSPRMRGAQ